MEDKEKLSQEIVELEEKMSHADFWEDKNRAQEIIKRLKELRLQQDGEKALYKGNAIMNVLAGAGGDDSEDFARMLFNMYEKYCTKNGFTISILHENRNDHDGIRNLTCEISGAGAYGKFLNENGVHRLVRISPFNANAKRHTSFAMIEVLPVLPDLQRVDLRPEDLDISFAKSSGPGGQNVNKRETAVRISHKPTGISVNISTERSQEANRERAMQILKSKIYKLEEEKRKAEIEGRQISKTTEIEWGNQIRNYVTHPYKLVKDLRTGVETSDTDGVFDGEIQAFLEAEMLV